VIFFTRVSDCIDDTIVAPVQQSTAVSAPLTSTVVCQSQCETVQAVVAPIQLGTSETVVAPAQEGNNETVVAPLQEGSHVFAPTTSAVFCVPPCENDKTFRQRHLRSNPRKVLVFSVTK